MRAHARELGVRKPSRILATGGGSNNVAVRHKGVLYTAVIFTW